MGVSSLRGTSTSTPYTCLEIKHQDARRLPCRPGTQQMLLVPLEFHILCPLHPQSRHSPLYPVRRSTRHLFGKLLVIITPNLPALYTDPGDSSSHPAAKSGLALPTAHPVSHIPAENMSGCWSLERAAMTTGSGCLGIPAGDLLLTV